MAQGSAGHDLTLIASNNLSNLGGTLSAGHDINAYAGNDLLDSAQFVDNGLSAGGGITAGNDLNLYAGHDLTDLAGTLSAGGDLSAYAGNDLQLASHAESSNQLMSGGATQSLIHLVGTLSAGGDLVLGAGHDLSSEGAQLTAGNIASLTAGHDVNLDAVTDNLATQWSGMEGNTSVSTISFDQTVRGTQVSGVNGVNVIAGHDLVATAATLQSANGAVDLTAGHNLTLADAQEEHNASRFTFQEGGTLLSDTTTFTATTTEQSLAVGDLLSGNTVTLLAGNDLTATAASIAGSGDVNLGAGGAIQLLAGQDTYRYEYSSQSTTNGAFGSGGLNVTIGSKSQTTTETVNQTSYTGSLVGSINGSTTVAAQGDTTITGSTVQSQQATSISGKNVTIDAAVGSVDTDEKVSFHSGGIHVGITGGAASVAQGVYSAAQGASQSSDSRLKALYAMQAAQDLYSPGAAQSMGLSSGNGADALSDAASDPHLAQGQGDNNSGSGINLQIGITASTAHSETKTHDDTTYGSQIGSAGNVTIAATGGDLDVVGSQINGQNVALAAAHDLNLLSQAEQHTDTSHNSNASGGVGINIGSGGIGFYAQAAVGKGQAHGNGTTHTDTAIGASDTLTLLSGNDTTIQGAQAQGNTVLASIGGDLAIASEQDTHDYASSQWEAQGQVVIGMGGSGSGSVSASEANSHYASVTQMSGIGAGSGGFDIHVGGNTDLQGAVIASSASPDQNVLDTGSLTYSNIQNEAQSSSVSISVGSGMSGGFSGGGSIPQSSDEQSTTQAGVAQGTIIVRDDPGVDLSGLDRDASLADAHGLTDSFDPQKEAENQQLGMLAGQVGMTAAGDLGQVLTQPYTQAAQQAVQDQQALNSSLLSDSGRQAIEADLAQQQATMTANQGTFDTWNGGGIGEVLLHTGVGAATAALGGGNVLQGALGAGVGEASMPYPTQQLGPQGAAVTSTLLGAAVGGGAGASTASAGAIYNDMHHYSDYQAELSACQSNPSGTGCGTILSMYGNESVPLSLPDSNNPSGVIANINTQTGQVVSYTLTNDQNQPVLIIQPSDYQNYLTLVEHDNYFYNAIGNYSPEYALQASNFLTDLENGNPSQAGGNLAGMFTNGSYWRDMGIGMAGAAGVYASSVTPALATEADSVAANADSLANQTTSAVSPAIANATADAEAGTSVTITNTTNSAIATTPEIGAGNGVATDTTVTSEGTANSATLQGLKDQLLNENLTNIAAQDPRLAAAVNGSGTNNINFSIGTGTATEADSLGQIWVGDGARPMNGVPGGLVSADGTRVYRPPTVKPNTPAQFAPTGVQANFQQLQNGVVISNGHLNITKP